MQNSYKNHKIETTFPVNLILAGKKCVVIGGGKVAARKVSKLLDADADITVYCDKPSISIQNFADMNKIDLHIRKMEFIAIVDAFLVFAATDDRNFNMEVVKFCNENKILCCAVDDNWPLSSFITPASFSTNGMTVSVSTAGKSCRYTKMINQTLKKKIENSAKLDFFVIGTDFKYLSIDERAKYNCIVSENKFGEIVSEIFSIREFFMINTCNRAEVVFLAEDKDVILNLMKKLLGFDLLDASQFYIKKGVDAFVHFIFVLSGLESQLLGENHIVNQIKKSFADAENRKWCASVLKSFFDLSLSISKSVRNEVRDLVTTIEIEDIVADYLSSVVDIGKHDVAVVGAGEVGRAIIKTISSKVKSVNWIYYMNKPNIEFNNVRIHSFDYMEEIVNSSQIVIAATSSSKEILINSVEGSRCFLAIDLGVPRNINKIFCNKVLDINELRYAYRKGIDCSSVAKEKANEIIKNNLDGFSGIAESLSLYGCFGTN